MTKSTKEAGRRVLLGQIGPAHGIRGEVLIRAYTGEPDAIAAYGPLADKSSARTFAIKVVRVTDKGVVARIAGVTDRNGAEALRGVDLYVERSALPKPADAEFYHADLIGLEAITEDGARYGRIVAVQNFGAGDLLEIERADGSGAEFIPFSNAHAPVVDLEAGRVTVVPMVMVGDAEPASDDERE